MKLNRLTEPLVLAFALIAATQLAMMFKFDVFSGHLMDPDCYSWLVRATQLHESGNWFDGVLHRVDPPYGLEQHWTRPFDVLLLIGAWALTPFLGFEAALYSWGVLISPLLQIFAVFILIWGFAPVFSHRQLILLAVGFIAQPAIYSAFLAGRPDHHSLITFLFVVSLTFVVRMLMAPERKLWAWAGGVVSALGFWVCIEFGVFVILPILLTLSILWILKEKYVQFTLFHYFLSLLLFSIIALLIQNRVSTFLRPEVDRLSIVFVFFFTLVFIYSFIVSKYNFINKIFFRTLFSFFSGLFVLIALYFIYPEIFSKPSPDTVYRAVRSGNLGQSKYIFIFFFFVG